MTRRLGSRLEALGLALGGRPGAPLAHQLGMPTSPNTLLRLLRRRPDSSAPSESGTQAPALTSSQLKQQASRARREKRFADVQHLHTEGMTRRAIARQLHMNRKSVARFLNAGVFPERAHSPEKPSLLDPYVPYLIQQLTAGHDNGLQLWRDICQQGYGRSRPLVSRWVAHHRHLVPTRNRERTQSPRRGHPPFSSPVPAIEARPHLSARRTAWLVLRRPEDLADPERTALEKLCQICDDVRVAHPLAQDFATMLRERRADNRDPWLERAVTSGIAELKRFAEGLQRDHAAVRAACSLSYSTGQVEGQINKLKLVKRSMYGRASFDLLRQRMLAADTS